MSTTAPARPQTSPSLPASIHGLSAPQLHAAVLEELLTTKLSPEGLAALYQTQSLLLELREGTEALHATGCLAAGYGRRIAHERVVDVLTAEEIHTGYAPEIHDCLPEAAAIYAGWHRTTRDVASTRQLLLDLPHLIAAREAGPQDLMAAEGIGTRVTRLPIQVLRHLGEVPGSRDRPLHAALCAEVSHNLRESLAGCAAPAIAALLVAVTGDHTAQASRPARGTRRRDRTVLLLQHWPGTLLSHWSRPASTWNASTLVVCESWEAAILLRAHHLVSYGAAASAEVCEAEGSTEWILEESARALVLHTLDHGFGGDSRAAALSLTEALSLARCALLP